MRQIRSVYTKETEITEFQCHRIPGTIKTWVPRIEQSKYSLFVWDFRHIREFFTHMKMSPLPVNCYKVWPILGTHGHWTARIHLLRNGSTAIYDGHLRRPVTLPTVAKCLAVELSLTVLTVCPDRGSNPNLSHVSRTVYRRGHNSLDCPAAGRRTLFM